MWWSQPGSNRRPPACKAGALPTELWPHWCSRTGLNRPPLDYQSSALPSELREHMAPREGLEPSRCPGSVIRRSIHLSYRGVLNGNPIVTGSRPESPVSFGLATTPFFEAFVFWRSEEDSNPQGLFSPTRTPAGPRTIGASLHVAQDRGFEPLEPLRAQRFSKPPQSASSANPAYGAPERT